MKLRTILAAIVLCPALYAAGTPANALLVLEKAQNTLVIVDPASMTIVARVPVGNDPHEVAVSDDGSTAYISNYSNGNTISVVDLEAQKALTPIDLGALRAPHGLTFAGGKLYFTAEAAKVMGRYDPATHKIDLVVGTGQDRTHMVTVSRNLKTICTSNVNSATVSFIEQGTQPAGRAGSAPDWMVASVPVGRGSEGFDLTPDGKELWVANALDHTISIVDVAAKKVLQTIPSTGAANRLKITTDGRYAFVSDLNGKEMLVVDTASRKEYKRITLPANSEGILMSPDGTKVYTTMNSRDAVAAIDLKTMTMTGEVKTGRGPDGLAWAARK